MAQASDEELKSLGLLPNQIFTEEEEQMMEDIVSATPSGVFERPRMIQQAVPLIDLTKELPDFIPIPDHPNLQDEDLRALIRKDDDSYDDEFRKYATMVRKQLLKQYFETESNINRSRRFREMMERRRLEQEARQPRVPPPKSEWMKKVQREQKKIGLTQGYLTPRQIKLAVNELPTPIILPEERFPPSEEVMAQIKKGGALSQEELEKAIKGMPKGCLPDGCTILKRGGNVYKKFIR